MTGQSLDVWTVDRVLERAVEFGPEREAIAFAERSISYGELADEVERLAAGMRDLGAEPGDRIAVLMANRPEYMALYYATARLGAVFVPIVTQSRRPEIEYFLTHSEAALLFTDGPRWDESLADGRGDGLDRALKGLKAIVCTEPRPGAVAYRDLISRSGNGAARADHGEDDLYAFMYTSGTTGRPKAVMHSHYTGVAQADAVAERLEYTPEDRLMTIFPLFHGNALVWSGLTAAYACGAFVLTERFSASRFWDQVRRYRATAVNLLIGAANMLLAQPEREDDRDHTLRLTAATVTQSMYERLTRRYGIDVVTLWALAEAPLGTMARRDTGYEPGLVGWPMGRDNEIRVVDENDVELPNGELGELVIRNRAVMKGYYKNPEETARVMRGGWVHSGDLGWRDDRGMFFFQGREKHVIRRSGENVSGEEVEECIVAHPKVAECAAIPAPDEIRGEEVKICVVPIEGVELTEIELVEWAELHLSDFKVPRYVDIRADLPRTGPEKVARKQLQSEPGITECWDRTRHVIGER